MTFWQENEALLLVDQGHVTAHDAHLDCFLLCYEDKSEINSIEVG